MAKIVSEGTTIKIQKASKVKWSWYYYGKPKEPENLLYYEFVVNGEDVVSTTNSPWSNKPSLDEAAVELC